MTDLLIGLLAMDGTFVETYLHTRIPTRIHTRISTFNFLGCNVPSNIIGIFVLYCFVGHAEFLILCVDTSICVKKNVEL